MDDINYDGRANRPEQGVLPVFRRSSELKFNRHRSGGPESGLGLTLSRAGRTAGPGGPGHVTA